MKAYKTRLFQQAVVDPPASPLVLQNIFFLPSFSDRRNARIESDSGSSVTHGSLLSPDIPGQGREASVLSSEGAGRSRRCRAFSLSLRNVTVP